MARKKRINRWECRLCPELAEDGPQHFDGAASFIEHVRAAHPECISVEGQVRFLRRGVSFLDYVASYDNTYEWLTADGRELAIQRTGGPRDADDPMRHG